MISDEAPAWAVAMEERIAKKLEELGVILTHSVDDQSELHESGRQHNTRIRSLERWRQDIKTACTNTDTIPAPPDAE